MFYSVYKGLTHLGSNMPYFPGSWTHKDKPSPKDVGKILEKNWLSIKDMTALLNSEKHIEQIREFVHNRFRKKENTVKYIAPIYLSNICTEKCVYCDYSVDKKKLRTRLSLDETEEEISTVMDDGARVIEFTLSTDPYFTPEKLTEYIQLAKKMLGDEPGSGVLLCSDYFTTEQYELLKDAGLWGIVQWDETLNIESYEKWHPLPKKYSPRIGRGTKDCFYDRMDTHENAIKAGLEVATGFLFGLMDFRGDTIMQIFKARCLRGEYNKQPFVFGTPRIHGSVPDEHYELALMVYKLAEPTIPRWLQTREKLELNLRNIVDGDVFTYKCGEVRPGGYSQNTNADSQFSVNESDKELCEAKLEEINFTIDYSWIGKT